MSNEEYYEKYHKLIYDVCKSYKRQPYYEDLVQECLIKMFEVKNRYNNEKSFSTYLYKCLSNQVIRSRANMENTIRIPEYKKGEGVHEIVPTRLKNKNGEWVDYYDVMVSQESDKNWKYNMQIAKEHLNKTWFTYITLRLKGYTLEEIGESEGVSLNWIHQELKRASMELKGKWCTLY